MRIGPHELASNVVLAPMAGVTDRPFRILCRQLLLDLERLFVTPERALRIAYAELNAAEPAVGN